MLTRVVAGSLLAFFVYSMINTLSSFGFYLLTSAAIVVAQLEFYRFYFNNTFASLPFIGILFGSLISMSFYFDGVLSRQEIITNIILSLLVVVIFNFVQSSIYDISITFFGIFYISWLLSHVILIRNFFNGKSLLFFLFLVTYSSDIGAYFIGKSFGKRKLCPVISPGKTWAGVIGGVFSSLAVAVIANKFLTAFSVKDAVILGILMGIAGPLGDLAESVLKRSAGVKDSGSLIPGHGGILDRIDSLIFASPVYYYYVLFFIFNENNRHIIKI